MSAQPDQTSILTEDETAQDPEDAAAPPAAPLEDEDESVSFDEDDAPGAPADTLRMSFSPKFSPEVYPSSIGDLSIGKLRESVVAPLVAQSRGYRTIAKGDEGDLKDTMREYALDGRTKSGKHLRHLVHSSSWMLIPYYRLDSVARGDLQLGTMQLRPETDPDEDDPGFAKYMFLAGSPTAIDANPAVPESWFRDPSIPVMFTEGVVKADSALTAMLRDAGVPDDQLRTDTSEDPRATLRGILESLPEDKRVLILAIPGVTSWRQNDEWNTLSLRGREAWVAFDGDIARNANVWDAARALMDFLDKRHASAVLLIDLSAKGVPGVDPKRGIDDFFAFNGEWSDAMALKTDALPARPVDDTGEKGDTRVTSNGLAVEVCSVKTDPATGGEIKIWKKVDDVGGRIQSFEEFRMPTGEEENSGRITPESVSRSERQAVVRIEWVDAEGAVDSADIRGPKGMLDDEPRFWETKHRANVPVRVSALPSWPPKSGSGWTRAIKSYRASERTDDVLWSCQGWVPTLSGEPVFIAGRSVIGKDGAGDESAKAGLTADEFPNIDDFGVIDEDMDLDRQRELLRRVVDAYTSSETFVDPRFGLVAMLAGIRPAVPITPHSVLYLVGGRRSGKSWLAAAIMAFWQSRGGAWSNERLPGSAMDSKAWMENAVSKSMMWIIDDFAPNSDRRQWEKQTSDLEQMVRSAFNRSARGRMTSDMKTRVSNPPRSFVVVTAENELQVDSARDRMVTLYSDRDGGFINPTAIDPLRTINDMSLAGDQARLSAQLLRFVCGEFARTSFPEVRLSYETYARKSVSLMKERIRQATPDGKVNPERHAGIVSEYALSIMLLDRYAKHLGMDKKFIDRISSMRDDLALVTIDLSKNQDNRTPGRALLAALRQTLESQKGYVESIHEAEVGQPPARDANTNLRLGWPVGRDPRGDIIGRYYENAKGSGEDIVLFGTNAFRVAMRAAPDLIPYGQTERTSMTALWNEGLAASGVWTRRKDRGGKATNMVSAQVGGSRFQGVPVSMDVLYPPEDED